MAEGSGGGRDLHQDIATCYSSLGGASVQVRQGLRYLLTLPVMWMRYLAGQGAGWTLLLDAWLSPCLCREDVSTKAHTLGRRHLSLPFAGLVPLHLPGLPFWGPEYGMDQNKARAWLKPSQCHSAAPVNGPPAHGLGSPRETCSCSGEVCFPLSKYVFVFNLTEMPLEVAVISTNPKKLNGL